MNRLPDLVNQRRTRRPVMDGRAWIVVWLLALFAFVGVVAAAPGYAQTDDPAPGTELGEDLYPPASYPTDEDRGIVGIGRYDIGCANDGFVGDVGCLTIGTATNLVFSLGKLMVALAIWLLEAATGFVIEAALTDAATAIARPVGRPGAGGDAAFSSRSGRLRPLHGMAVPSGAGSVSVLANSPSPWSCSPYWCTSLVDPDSVVS